MKRRWPAALALLGLAGCAELFGPRAWRVALDIVPVFDRTDAYVTAAANADSLRIRVLRAGDAGEFRDTVVRATVAIDPDSGTANTTINVVLLESPQEFRVLLAAVRSSDGAVLFSGATQVQVVAGSGPGGGGQQVSIPVAYTGPRAARLVLGPRDTVVAAGGSFTMRATAYDSADAVVNVAPRFYLRSAADSVRLKINRLTGVVTTVTGQSGLVHVYALTPDSLAADTTSIFVGAPPAAVRVTPGYANVGIGASATLSGAVVDAAGNPVTGSSVSWVSRSTGVATVAGTGAVTGVATGTAVIVASGSGFSDSALVTVPPATNVVVSTTSNGRGFRAAGVNDTVVVDVTADMTFSGGEKIGSYNARMTWNAAVLQYLGVQATTFAAPTVNADSAAGGSLRFAGADAAGGAGQAVVARVRFRALAAGTTSPTIAISEMSASSPTYTNLLTRVTVTSGFVTVRP